MLKLILLYTAAVLLIGCGSPSGEASTDLAGYTADPLPGWAEGPRKQAILDFVSRTTTPGDSAFIPEADRIAVFDNDGTLWAEQPAYFQLFFAIDRIKTMASSHPEWTNTEPFKSVLAGDMASVMKTSENGLAEIVMASHAGMPVDTFDRIVREWIDTARHPATRMRYVDMVYAPMLELLHFLRANGFKTFIVSGGGIDFLRAWAEEVYGIPPHQVVGSAMKTTYRMQNGRPELAKAPAPDFIDDKEGKVIGIYRHIGKRPVFAAGNSDGDVAMLEYTMTGTGYPRFGMIVHHTDSLREYAYGRNSHIGKLAVGLDSAAAYGWVIVDMAKDWTAVYPVR